jgi:polar amino acid transport system substrate-binding protein
VRFKNFVLLLVFMLAIVLLQSAGAASAAPKTEATPATPADRELVIATRSVPPFAFKKETGEWNGLAIDLWRDIATQLGLKYRFVEAPTITDLIDGVSSGKYDLGVGAITVTSAREKQVEFSHPFFSTGLAIATQPASDYPILSTLSEFLTMEILQIVLIVIGSTILVGFLIWFLERRSNEALGSAGEGFWSSLSMLLTSQFSEPGPRTLVGRVIAVAWVFASIILMTFFTGFVASSLTVQSLHGRVQGVSDLPKMRVGAVRGTTGATWLNDTLIPATSFEKVQDALQAVEAGKVDAVVYDAPVLQYLQKTMYQDRILILPDKFAPQEYALALPLGSPLRRPINQQLLSIKEKDAWRKKVFEFTGEQ